MGVVETEVDVEGLQIVAVEEEIKVPGGDRKKENILDLTKYMDKEITVKFSGGRESKQCPFAEAAVLVLTVASHRDPKRLRPTNEPGPGQCERNHKRLVLLLIPFRPRELIWT